MALKLLLCGPECEFDLSCSSDGLVSRLLELEEVHQDVGESRREKN